MPQRHPLPSLVAAPGWSRRHFLRLAGGAAVSLLIGCRPQSTPIPLPTSSPAVAPTPTPPATATSPRAIRITPTADFYEQQYQGVAEVDVDSWRLTIDGLVRRPLTLDDAAVRALPRAEMMRTLECIGNPVGGNQIGNANWAGFWLADVLAQAGVRAEARRARLLAADGYETSVDAARLMEPGVLMAYEMNGEPLTPAHGFPLRIFLPGLYGQKMPKWITQLDFIADAGHRGYWEQRGWSDEAVVKTNSQIVSPAHISRLPLGDVAIDGVAYAGIRPITRVEIGIESGGNPPAWQDATLLPGPSAEVWTQFYHTWRPTAATSYTLYVRATDSDGFRQNEIGRGILEGAFPDGTDKIQNIVVQIG